MIVIWVMPWWALLFVLWLNAAPPSRRSVWRDDFSERTRWLGPQGHIITGWQCDAYYRAGLSPEQAAQAYKDSVAGLSLQEAYDLHLKFKNLSRKDVKEIGHKYKSLGLTRVAAPDPAVLL